MSRELFRKMIFSVVLILIMIPTCVFARGSAAIGGGVGSSGACQSTYKWCYHSYAHIGFRLTLYEYDGSTLRTLGTSDYKPVGSNMDSGSAIITTSRSGKVAYMNGTYLNWPSLTSASTQATSLSFIKSSTVTPFYNITGVLGYSEIFSFVKNKFSLNSNNGSTIKRKIKNEFGLSDAPAELKNIYITAEPTMFFWHQEGGSPVDYFYGTAYEITGLRSVTDQDYKDFMGMAGEIYSNLPLTLTASSIVGRQDPNRFIPNLVELATSTGNPANKYLSNNAGDFYGDYYYLRIAYSSELNVSRNPIIQTNQNGHNIRDVNDSLIRDKKGYAIQVYWIGQYAPSCTDECSRTTAGSRDRLVCAQKWCARNDNDNKESCINSCGYTPKTRSCSSSCSAITTSATTCADTASVSSKTCNAYVTDYVKVDCTADDNNSESVTYSNDLPTTLLSGLGGFNYSVSKTTKKNCVTTFDTERAEYDYAILNTDNARTNFVNNTLKPAMVAYYNIKTSQKNYANYWDAAAETSNLNINFKVGSETYTTDTTGGTNRYPNAFTKQNTIPTTPNITQSEPTPVYLLNGDSSTVATYSAGGRTQNRMYKYTIKTSNTDVYQLAPRCYTLLNGRVNKIPSLTNATCRDLKYKDTDLYGYFGYYSNVTTTSNRATQVNTTTSVSGRCIRNTNRCQYYVVDESFECITKVTKVLNKYKVTFEVEGYKTGGTVINYSFDGTSGTYLGPSTVASKEYSPHAHNYVTKTAYITYNASTTAGNKTIKKTCNFVIPPEDEDTDYNTCKEIYSGDSCKNINEIQQYCQKNWFTDKAGYQSENDCVKDCSCGPTTTPTKGYTYRPISLGDGEHWSDANGDGPFPNGRDPGYNWKGEDHEFDIIKSDEETFGGEPIYVIKLDADAIAKIRRSNRSDTTVYLNYKNRTSSTTYTADRTRGYLFYKSNYITSNSDIFTRGGA